MGGKITTHVLDLSKGKPAAGMGVELWTLEGTESGTGLYRLAAALRLNEDGRPDAPVLEGLAEPGIFELRFDVKGYFGSDAPVFLDWVPVRFIVSDPEAHYHVPLLVSPGGYSTYRGS